MLRRVAVALSLAFVFSLVAADPAPAQQPKRGGVLRMAEREAPSLDPHLSVSFLTHSYVSLVGSQLVRFPYGPEQQHPGEARAIGSAPSPTRSSGSRAVA